LRLACGLTRLRSGRLLPHLSRQLLRLLAQSLLLARELLELTPQLVGGGRRLGEIALPPAQLLLPAREIPYLVERGFAVLATPEGY
jgi:hypothetical protein